MRLSKQEKELMKQAYSVPAPKKKRAFLRTLPRREAGLGALILSQAAYIRKWVWAVSLLLFGVVVWMSAYVQIDIIWTLSAVMPFGAMVIVMEFVKSSAHGMAELEMTSRFSLRTILLARMSMLGVVQLFGLFLTMPVIGELLLQKGVYLAVPYLLTAVLGLMAVRRFRGREGIYACGSISAFVCVLCPISGQFIPFLYEEQSFVWWVLAAVLLAAGLVKEYGRTMNSLEEMTWN